MANVSNGNSRGEPAGGGVAWDDLTSDQQAGMTREYWESELDDDARRALADPACSHPDCNAPRWIEVGSYYCPAHTRLVAAAAGPR